MKNVLLILSITLINFISAQEIHKSMKVKSEYTFSGKLTGFNEGDKISFYNPEIMKTLDSTYLKNGSFKLKNPLSDTPEIIFLIVNNDMVFIPFIAGENVTVSGDKKDFKFNLEVKGSKFQKEKELLDNQIKNHQIERDSLEKYFDDSDTSKTYAALQKVKLKRINEIDKITDSVSIKYIKENPNSYYALLILQGFYDKFSKDELLKFYSQLDNRHKASKYGKSFKTYIEVGKILEKGDPYFDFKAKGQDGKMHKLSEIKGRYILLDFNETYCGPCVASVGELKKVALHYKGQLEIVSFCADKPEDIWKTGLKRDKPEWLSLWDGKGTQGSTVVKYGTNGFPTFILIYKTGKIIDRIIGFEKGIIEKSLKENIKL